MKKIIALFFASLIILLSAPSFANAAPVTGYHALTPDPVNKTDCKEDTGSGCDHALVIISAIKSVPCPKNGQKPAVIRASVFNLNMDAYVRALKSKVDCGVNLHFLTYNGSDEDGDRNTSQDRAVERLVKGHSGSWYKECKWSCYDTRKKGSTHQKIWSFSNSNLVINNSANDTAGTEAVMFTDYTVVYDSCMHKGISKWIDDGRADKKRKAPKSIKSCNGSRIFHLSPGSKNTATDMLHSAKYVKGCRAIFDMHIITLSAGPKEMIRLHKSHCSVRAVVNWRKFSEVKKPSKTNLSRTRMLVRAGVPTYDISWSRKVYGHRMTTAVYAKIDGKTQKRMTSGSTNQTSESFISANSIVESRVGSDVDTAFRESDKLIKYTYRVSGKPVNYAHRLTLSDVGCVGKKQPEGC